MNRNLKHVITKRGKEEKSVKFMILCRLYLIRKLATGDRIPREMLK